MKIMSIQKTFLVKILKFTDFFENLRILVCKIPIWHVTIFKFSVFFFLYHIDITVKFHWHLHCSYEDIQVLSNLPQAKICDNE